MSSRHTIRQTVSKRDENSDAVTSRITRAKASATGGFQYTSLEQSGMTGAVVPARKRAALGDLSNVGRTRHTVGKPQLNVKPTVEEAVPSKPGLQRRKPLGDKSQSMNHKAATNNPQKAKLVLNEPSAATKLDSENIRGQNERKLAQSLVSVYRGDDVQRKPLGNLPLDTVNEHGKPIGNNSGCNNNSNDKKSTNIPSTSAKRAASTSVIDEDQEHQEQVTKRRKVDVEPLWDDLDAEDADDPPMVSEYVGDIFNYLYDIENSYVIDQSYMDSQSEIDWAKRDVLVDWLIEVHSKFRLLPETLFLTVNLMDRFLSQRDITTDRLQISGLACLFIASKYEEIMAPSVNNFSYVMNGCSEDVLRYERKILKAINYDLSYPNPLNYLRRISKADDYDIQTRTIAKYLLEISLFEPKLVSMRPSKVAAGAMYLSRLMLQRGDWTANLAHYSGDFSKDECTLVASTMIDYLKAPIVHESFFKKYASKRFLKASIIAREWAQDNWSLLK